MSNPSGRRQPGARSNFDAALGEVERPGVVPRLREPSARVTKQGFAMKMKKMDGMGRETGEMETVEFTPPEDLRLDGESGEAMINWTMTPEGRLRITAIEGVSLGGSEMEDDEDVKETMARGIDDMGGEYV